MIKVKDLFHVKYGNKLDLNKQAVVDNGVNFVNRSSKNLGISCQIRELKDVFPFEKGLITVALGGSILETYIQPKKFYTGQNVKVLRPKRTLSYKQKIFYCLCIKENAYRYSAFGREANKTLDNLLIPSLEELPKWVNETTMPKPPSKNPYHNKVVGLNDREWKIFKIKKIFTIEKGVSLIKNFDKGNIPLVSSTNLNNGIFKFVNKISRKPFKKNLITVSSNGSVGESFYQKKPFYATCDVNILIPLFPLNVYIAMFLNTVIELEKYRFGYGRKWGKAKMLNSNIKLPITKDDNPDWQFMESYIKSLPYSANLGSNNKDIDRQKYIGYIG